MATEIADLVATIRVDTRDVEAGAQRVQASTQKMAASIQMVSTSLQAMSAQGTEALSAWVRTTEQAARAGDRLGAGFSEVKRSLNISAATAKAGQDLQSLRTAMDAGIITQGQFERASASMSRQLLVMGGQGPLIERFGSQLQTFVRAGIEPIAAISPTAGRALTSFVGTLGPVGIAAGAAGVAVGLAGKQLFDLAKSTADAGAGFANLATKTGVSVDTLSSLQLAAQRGNTTMAALGTGINALQRSMVGAANGNREMQDAFTTLGVSVTDTEGRLRPVEAVLEDVARGLTGVQSEALRTDLGMQLMNRNANELKGVLGELATVGVKGLREESQRLGVHWTTEQAAAAQSFQDNLNRLSASATGLGQAIGNALLPPLNAFLEFLMRAPTEVEKLQKELFHLQNSPGAFDPNFRRERMAEIERRIPIAQSAPLSAMEGAFAENAGGTAPDLSRLKAFTDANLLAVQAQSELVTATKIANKDLLGLLEQRKNDAILKTTQQLEAERAMLPKALAETKAYKEAESKLLETFAARNQAINVQFMDESRTLFQQFAPTALAGISTVRDAFRNDLPNDISSGTARIREVLGLTAEETRGASEAWLDGVEKIKGYKAALDAAGQMRKVIDPDNTKVVDDLNRGIEELIRKIEELAKKAGITGTELKRAFGDIPGVGGGDKSMNLGGASSGTGDFAARTGDAFRDVREAANEAKDALKEYTRAEDEAAAAGKRLDTVLTGNSLDKSALAVGQAFRSATQASQGLGQGLGQALGSVQTVTTAMASYQFAIDGAARASTDLGGATRDLVLGQQSLTAEYISGVPALESITNQVIAYGRALAEAKRIALLRSGLASSGLGSGDLAFTDAGKMPATYGGNALTGQGGATGGVFTGSLSLADLLAMRSPDITGRTRPVPLGGGPGGLRGGFSLDVDVMIGRILDQMLQQAKAQQLADEYVRKHLEPKLRRLEERRGGGFGMGTGTSSAMFGGDIPFVGSFAGGGTTNLPPGMPGLALVHGREDITPVGARTPTVVVNLNGMTVLQSREALTELAFTVADIVADQARRTRR